MSANTTMESFQQHLSNGCFRCHQGTDSMLGRDDGEAGLSRIWGPLKPLFPPN